LQGQTASADFPITFRRPGLIHLQIVISMFFALKLDFTAQATKIYFQNINCSQMDVHWQKGDGAKRCGFYEGRIHWLSCSGNNTFFTLQILYLVSGSQIGSSGWFCVYYDTGEIVKKSAVLN